MTSFLTALFVLTFMYGAFMIWCFAGWKKLKIFRTSVHHFITRLSVIIPARNEEKNITNCLHDLLNQNYPKDLVELIVADDHSDDRTAEIVNLIIEKHPDHKIILLHNSEKHGTLYKKTAISHAVEKCNGELIITTDADCRMSPDWLATFASYYESEYPFLIAGPVCISGKKNFLEELQSLEFMGLIGIGAGSIFNERPMMCNGANLAYTKKIFWEVNGFADRSESVSGDDTQLLLKIAKINSSKIHFLKSKGAIVYTTAMNSVTDLLHQRKRWASKIPLKMSLSTLIIAGIAYLIHLGILVGFFLCLFNPSIFLFLILIFLMKCVSEFILLNSLAIFFKRKGLLWLFLPAQIIYMVYVTFIGIAATFGSYRWKERKINTDGINMSMLKKKSY